MDPESVVPEFNTDSMPKSGLRLTPVGAALLSPDLHWLRIDRTFCELLGYPLDELRALGMESIIHPHDLEKMKVFRAKLLSDAVQAGKLEARYIRKDRSSIDTEIRSVLIASASGKPHYFVDIVEDITASASARRSAGETAGNGRHPIENFVGYGLFQLDSTGAIATWTSGAERLFGYTGQEIVGRSSAVLFTPEDKADEIMPKELAIAWRNGCAQDERWYVRKDKSRVWASAMVAPMRDEAGHCSGFVKILHDLTDRKLVEEHALYLAQHDRFTGLANRDMFHDELHCAIEEAKANDTLAGVLFIAVDRFQDIKESLGHHVSDALLKSIADRLCATVHGSDVVARLGRDEFGVIGRHLSRHAEVAHLAHKLVHEFSRPFAFETLQVNTSASIGVTIYPQDADEPERLLKNADLAMHHAQCCGGNNYQLYTEGMDRDAKRRHTIEEGLRRALENGELSLHYQPQIAFDSPRPCALEALLRWKNGAIPLLTLEELIAVADDTGLIVPIGAWVLGAACAQLKTWQQAGLFDVRVALNLSSRQLEDKAFLRTLDRALEEGQIAPQSLEMEISECLFMDNGEANLTVLQQLQQRGVRIAITHLGAGLSSLAYLKRFSADTLKIDRMFVKGLPANHHDATIASATIGIAHGLGMSVIAEGIEHEAQLEFLRSLGCDGGQGFLFSGPVPASAQLTRELLGSVSH